MLEMGVGADDQLVQFAAKYGGIWEPRWDDPNEPLTAHLANLMPAFDRASDAFSKVAGRGRKITVIILASEQSNALAAKLRPSEYVVGVFKGRLARMLDVVVASLLADPASDGETAQINEELQLLIQLTISHEVAHILHGHIELESVARGADQQCLEFDADQNSLLTTARRYMHLAHRRDPDGGVRHWFVDMAASSAALGRAERLGAVLYSYYRDFTSEGSVELPVPERVTEGTHPLLLVRFASSMILLGSIFLEDELLQAAIYGAVERAKRLRSIFPAPADGALVASVASRSVYRYSYLLSVAWAKLRPMLLAGGMTDLAPAEVLRDTPPPSSVFP